MIADSPKIPLCRFCGSVLRTSLVDLGPTPLANCYLNESDILLGKDKEYSLHARVCPSCFLVQVDDSVEPGAIFSEYAYFSSYTDSWVEHARQYAAAMTERFSLNAESNILEVASNDGYLLQHFLNRGSSVFGIEPAANVAEAATAKGIPTKVAFFGRETASELANANIFADLTVANNVLAHVPDIRDFVTGFVIILKPEGVATFEFPHLLRLIDEVQFDTIYHEHFSYLSLLTLERIFSSVGLRIFDVEKLGTHGGSLRIFACHKGGRHRETSRLVDLRTEERAAALDCLTSYEGFSSRVDATKKSFLSFLEQAKDKGKKIAGYGAAAKGNTFLNVCRVKADAIAEVFDVSLAKQGKYLPGSHIPIRAPEFIRESRPDYLVILPWNLADEVRQKVSFISEWGGRFVVAVPMTHVLD